MANKKNSEEKLIEKIDKVNKKMKEINQEPLNNEGIKKKLIKVSSKKNNDEKKTAKKIEIDKNIEKKEIALKNIEDSNKNIKIKKNKFGIFEIVLVLVNVALIFCLLGYLIGNKINFKNEEYTTVDKELQLFIDQYNNVLENYYGDINKDEIIKDAINGMLSSLDDYSGVVNGTSNNFDITLQGSYIGIGLGVSNTEDKKLIAATVYEDTPASESNIKVGDIITHFNGNILKEVTSAEFVEMVKQNEIVVLTLQRGTDVLEVSLTKRNITLRSVFYEMKGNEMGYIQVGVFANNTYDQFKKALQELENKGMKKLILDLRGNSGGHLTAVKSMLELFMDKTHVLYQTQNKEMTEKVYSTGNNTKTYKIVILQDGLSASASEVMSSSLKENLNAYIIGKTSFGKGTVQQLQNVNNIEYKFTTKKWLTPNGTWINDIGVKPDLEISLTEEYFKEPIESNDSQYQAAVNYFK